MALATSSESFAVATEQDIVCVRQAAKRMAIAMGSSALRQTKVITAASELVRNALQYGAGGMAHLDYIDRYGRRGLRLIVEDQGPGIADIDQALSDGYTTGGGLGLGLGGAKRLSDEFVVESEAGQGVLVTAVWWD